MRCPTLIFSVIFGFPVVSHHDLRGVEDQPIALAGSTTGQVEKEPTFSWVPRTAPVPVILTSGTISGFAGVRAISGPAWRDLGPIFQVGAQAALGATSWWVRPVVGYYHASGGGEYADTGEYDLNLGFLGSYREFEARGVVDVAIDELALGVGHEWAWRWLRVAGAGGAGWVHAKVTDTPAKTIFRQFALSDLSERHGQAQTVSWWTELGVRSEVGVIQMGLAVRYTYAGLTVIERDLDAGGTQLGGTLTWDW